MVCPSCGSKNVNVQIVTESKLVDRHHGIIWWLCVGWWWIFFKWLFLTVPALLAKIFIPKRQKMKQKQITMCVCQACGNKWEAK